MVRRLLSPQLHKAIAFARDRRTWFKARELPDLIGCTERTARYYCAMLSEEGVLEVASTFPSKSFRIKSAAKIPTEWKSAIQVFTGANGNAKRRKTQR